MRKIMILILSYVLISALTGCFAVVPAERDTASAAPDPTTSVVPVEENTPDPSPAVTDFVPTMDDVLAARERALAGMSEQEIKWLMQVIKSANLWWEQMYMWDNIFGRLANPDDLNWNYFDQTGEIQIGWAYDSDLDKDAICREENLTEDEFYAKYAKRVVTENDYDADAFIAILEDIKAGVQDEALRADLQYIMDELSLAKETHDMEHANNLYKVLHDMDYFLLRYGPVDVGAFMSDTSTVSKYYGMLSIYS